MPSLVHALRLRTGMWYSMDNSSYYVIQVKIRPTMLETGK